MRLSTHPEAKSRDGQRQLAFHHGCCAGLKRAMHFVRTRSSADAGITDVNSTARDPRVAMIRSQNDRTAPHQQPPVA
jgi:hypothetical protein